MKRQPIQSKNSAISQAKGFTLIELIVALVILGILLAAGIPGMQSLLDNMSIRSNADRLTNTFAYARGEAVARVDNVSVRSISGGTDWSTGWRVFLDANGDCSSTGDTIIRVVEVDEDRITVDSAATNCIAFDRFGEKTTPLAGTTSLTISRNSATSRTVSITPTGAVR